MADVERWPGYDLVCHACGAAVRPIDQFCSQCGRRDPAYLQGVHSDDTLLTSATLVSGEVSERPDTLPTFVAPDEAMSQETLIKSARRRESTRLNTQAVESLLAPGTVFGRRYRIQRFLGSGAMGYVCCAIDESIDEVVALKVLSLPIHEDPDAYERFKTELKLARRIRHRNVVQSFDLGFAEGYPFISMEYIDADNLLKHLNRRTRFDEQSALAIIRQVLRGLHAAHALGIVHRDIKPENILLNKDRMAFITDFGVATSQDLVQKELAGTPDYMAPEQLRCEPVVAASDLYSCGVVLYRMLTGALPYRATSIKEVLEAHLHAKPEPIDESLGISPGVRDLIASMLEKKVADRPRSARELLERIDEIIKASTMSRSASKRVTALVIDHDPQSLSFLTGVLQGEGYRVLATGNAREGINLAFEQTPAIIFLDAQIRGGFDLPVEAEGEEAAADGLGFVRVVQRDDRLRPVPIVLMTDHSLTELGSAFEKAGVSGAMMKPLSTMDVLGALSLIKPGT
ncbi:MAG: eukaryotic-like serine/threonine-protein kinase [Thermoanaerobaculia bacterium]|jgi:CheY-like chemotaxis protein|nr:eukaryotic-like serine/threonine-protein kinase [Thermoanaerobaculia bacterium]